MRRKEQKQPVLEGGEGDLLAGTLHVRTVRVDGERAQSDGAPACRLRAPEHAGDARQKLARAEGLGDVVVSPELEPGNGGELVARRGEEHDGQLGHCLLEGSADGKAVAFGKGDVKQDEGVRTRAVAAGGERAGKRRRLRGSGVDRIALALKKLSQGGDDGSPTSSRSKSCWTLS